MVALGTTDVRICLGLAAEGSSATGEAHWRGRPGSWALTAAAGPRASTHCWARLARSRTVPLASLGQTEATTPGGEAPRRAERSSSQFEPGLASRGHVAPAFRHGDRLGTSAHPGRSEKAGPCCALNRVPQTSVSSSNARPACVWT